MGGGPLASKTIPKDDLWVNLAPYEEGCIIPEELGRTELGRDLLSQDYLLKQLTASLVYPEDELGQEFWNKARALAYEKFGTTEIPINTFNKVWILPESATVYEHGQTVYIVESHLKVMLNEDYLALQKNAASSRYGTDRLSEAQVKNSSAFSSQVVREVILPVIEEEINEGKQFAVLRQIYASLILAKWYKESMKNSLLNSIYVDQHKTAGVEMDDVTVKERIYRQYMDAYRKGVFNYIKEDYDRLSKKVIFRAVCLGPEVIRIPY